MEASIPRSDPVTTARQVGEYTSSFLDCCGGWGCFRRRRQRCPPETQILTPRDDSIDELREKQSENAGIAFRFIAKKQVDMILVELQSKPSLITFPTNVIKPLMLVARGLLYNVSGAGKERVIQKLFRLIIFFGTESDNKYYWNRILDVSHEIVSQLRPLIL
jgi:hypothetical protein